jgi:lipase chaperone LimK
LIIEKDKDMSEKKDRPTKRIFKDLVHSQHTRVKKQTSHETLARQISLEKFKDSHFFL